MLNCVLIIILVASMSACGRFMQHSRCDDTIVNKSASPDGKHQATLIHRSCSSGTTFTYAKLEDSSKFPWLWSGDYEYLISLIGTYPIEAEWQDNTHLQVRSPRLKEQDKAYLNAVPPKTGRASRFRISNKGLAEALHKKRANCFCGPGGAACFSGSARESDFTHNGLPVRTVSQDL
jgi:hypothetical protein